MSGEFEAAGTAIEGALLGAAVERTSGSISGDTSHGSCLNCGTTLAGRFCSSCGQKAHVHRKISAIWHDILHSVLHFDGKLWRTLPLLMFKPGALTRRYIHGERSKFVSPMAIFLFAIFLMFAAFSFGGDTTKFRSNWTENFTLEAKKLDIEIAKKEAERLRTAPDSSARMELETKLKELKSERNGAEFVTAGRPLYDDEGIRISGDGPKKMTAGGEAETGWPWLDSKLNIGGRKMIENPSLAFYKIKSNGYKFAWLLIPLSIPFMALVTLGLRGHHFYDHAVFVTYSISFMSLLFLIASLMGWAGISDNVTVPSAMIIALVHLYKQLRYSYALTRGAALLRLIPLLLSIQIVLLAFAIILLLLGLMG
jgi:hypothetical protein